MKQNINRIVESIKNVTEKELKTKKNICKKIIYDKKKQNILYKSENNKLDIVVNINLNKIMNTYEISAVLINFLPVLIFSSSPKLNFFIKAPVAIEIPAAGVASANNHVCIDSNASCKVEINFGYAAYDFVEIIIIKIEIIWIRKRNQIYHKSEIKRSDRLESRVFPDGRIF